MEPSQPRHPRGHATLAGWRGRTEVSRCMETVRASVKQEGVGVCRAQGQRESDSAQAQSQRGVQAAAAFAPG